MNFTGWEIMLVVAVLFLLFGASRLPQLAKSLGQSRKAFKEGLREAEEEERVEREQLSAKEPPRVSTLSDEDLAEEIPPPDRSETRVESERVKR